MPPKLALLGLLALPSAAIAAPVTTTFCFEASLSYADGSVGDLLTGSNDKARGNRVQFMRESDSVVVFDGYVEDTGSNAGCITMDGTGGTVQLDTASAYTVKLPREASIEGNTILVRTSSGGTYTLIATTGLVPTSNRTYSYSNGDTWTRGPATDAQLILSAAGWALHHRDAGLTGETFTLRNAGCSGSGSTPCYDDANEIMWVGVPDRKFVIGHLLGLAVTHYTNFHDFPETDATADVNDYVPGEPNAGHKINTEEYTSNAVVHGIARFYAAAVFNNNGSDADCEYQVTYAVDWNADGDSSDTDEDETFSCSASPAPGLSINDYAYFDEVCFTGSTVNNRTTPYDWLKMWWDMHTDSYAGGYSVPWIFGLFSDANPDSWVETGDLGGGTTDYPYDRLYDAEGGGPFGDFNWLGAGTHGVHH